MSVGASQNKSIQIYNGKYYKALVPTPLAGITHTNNRNEMGFLYTETSITLNGYSLASSSEIDRCEDLPMDSCIEPSSSGATPVGAMFEAQRKIEELFNGNDLVVQFCDTKGRIKNSYACQLESISFGEGTWNQYMPYTVTLKSYQSNFTNSNGVYKARPAIGTSGVLTDFNDTISVEPIVGEYGLHRANPANQDQEPIGQIYYRVSRSITASAKTWTNRRRVQIHDDKQHNKFKNTDGIAPGWIVAHDYLEDYLADPTEPHHSTEFLLHSGHWLANSTSTNRMYPYNFTRQTEIDKASGRYGFTDSFVLAPKNINAMETFDISYSSSAGEHTPVVTVNGTIQGLTRLGMHDAGRKYTDLSNSTIGTAPNNVEIDGSGQIDNAFIAYSQLTKNGRYGFCRMFSRAQQATSQHLNTSPRSITMGSNDVAGQVTYSLEYDARPTNYFEGVASENITVDDTYPGDMYTTIPILGRPTGPILQYLYGRTEYKRTLSVELIIDSSSTSNAATFSYAKRETALGSKPSLRPGFREQIQGLINLYSPANEPGIKNWFQDPPQESWTPKECRYTFTVTWTYEISE